MIFVNVSVVFKIEKPTNLIKKVAVRDETQDFVFEESGVIG